MIQQTQLPKRLTGGSFQKAIAALLWHPSGNGYACMSLDYAVRPFEKVSALCRTMMCSVRSDRERRALGHHSQEPGRGKKTEHFGPKQ